ncbi:hypothetical protein C8Q79DRAFT_1014974 [Trametes meyenii]|nr:hypothetical protein C8Q79DRAFT_1014974 [Trametes meyenii]
MIIANPDQPEKVVSQMPPSVPPKDAASGSKRIDELPPPPPYSPAAGPSRTPPAPARLSGPQRSQNSIFRPENPQTVNHFEVFSKHNPIAGTYLVDPLLSSPAMTPQKKSRKRRNKVWGKGSGPSEINASFRTRHGAISLNLAIVAESERAPTEGPYKVPAGILVSSKHGRINMNLASLERFEVQPSRSIDLHVESTHGKIVILVPPTFDGPLMFQCRGSPVSFLPAFAARTRTLRATDRETLVMCSAPDSPEYPKPLNTNPGGQDNGDRVLVRTRHGRVVVGISGLDRVEDAPAGAGLLKKIGELLELGGRAFGQYLETHASTIEKKLTERSAQISQHLDAKFPDRAAIGRN